MLSASDFNNAVPQFTNGNYASNPLNPQYIAEPSSTEYCFPPVLIIAFIFYLLKFYLD